ncbi:relaxase/mobilization nuclease domain-containing protein [Streptomyces sp. NPDC055080]
MAVNIKVLRYIAHKGTEKPINKAKEHIKYMEANRETHRNNPDLFNGKENDIDRKDFFKRIENQPRNGVALHKFVITISQDERDRLNIDLRELARDTIAAFETKTGLQLDWVGSIHDDEGHPHVHIAYRGKDLNGKDIFIGPKQIEQLKRVAEREKVRQAELTLSKDQIRDIEKELEKERSYNPEPYEREYRTPIQRDFSKTMFNLVDQLIKQSQRDIERVQNKAWKDEERDGQKRRKNKGRGMER